MMILEMELFSNWRISCYTQEALIYGTHLLFAIVFLLSLTMHKFYAQRLSRRAPVEAPMITTSGSVSVLFSVVSILCCLIGLASLGLGVWLLLARELPVPYGSWVSLVLQGLVWILLAITFKIRLESFVAIIACAWWIFTFLLMTFYAYSSGMQLMKGEVLTSGIILVFISWPISWIFIPCAIVNLRKNYNSVKNGMNEPLLSDSLAGETKNAVNPLERAGIFSKLCFTWLSPLLALGNQRPLQKEDIPDIGEDDQSGTAYRAFLEAWEMQKKKNPLEPQSVFTALVTCHWKDVTKTGFYALLKCITISSGPLLLFAFIGFSTGQEIIEYQGFILVVVLLILKLLESMSQRHWYFGMRRVGLKIRAGLLAAIYQKELRLSNLGRQRHGTGEIVSYVSVDAYRLGEFAWWLHQIWLAPLQVIIALAILYAIVGWAFLSGLFVILITVVINGPFAKHMQNCQSQLMKAQDERLKMMTVIMSSMKIVKLQAWEDKFKSIIEALRQSEFKWLSSLQSNRSYASILYWMSPIVTASIVLGTAVLLGYSLTSTVVFTVLATFRIIQEPVRQVPDIIANTMQAKVSISRLNNFLLDDELQPDAVVRNTSKISNYSVSITNGKLSWDSTAPIATLNNINMLVKHGELVAICGMVGSGKSTLLCAILGEISKLEGTVQVNGSIAYVAQTAWIQSGTVRDNILFGQPMNRSRYKQALSASALDQDIEQFSHGDLTEIGERGLNMSGGQKQRIQLARAIYSDADIFLLDDPFSAVDAHTAAILFKECILGALSKKTVILVTHQVEFLPSVDTIVVMHSGTIMQMGSYEDLLMAGNVFEQLVSAHQEAMVDIDNYSEVQPISFPINAITEVQRQLSITKSPSRKSAGFSVNQALQLVQEEEREKGDLGLKPYLQYIRKGRGLIFFTLLVFMQSGFVTGQFLSNYWLATQLSKKKTSAALLIGIYAALAFGSIAFLHARSRMSLHLGLGASRAFFSGLLNSLFRAPMAVFDSTPIGRILSRASTDLSILDIDIPFALGFVIAGSIELLVYVIAIALVTWQVLFIAIPTLAITWRLQNYYLQPTRELMRINGTTKAPIVNNTAETITGAVTIRAFQKQKLLEEKNRKLIDNDSGVYFYIFTAYEWVALRLETLGTVVLCGAALIMVLLPKNQIQPGFAGFSLSYGLGLNPLQLFLTQWSCNLANYIISVERVEQYTQLPCEAPAIVESYRPAAEWPSKGKIEFQNLHVRYREGAPLVLRGITCTIQGGQRVGVVGRTGSGKTTLISSLFRLVEPADGRIIIDNIDIAKIGTRDLRSKLGIIPQEPFLFRGTVRSNLDPLQQHTDDAIWEILAKCQLKKIVEDYPHQLDAQVSDDGENWSAGQRQLFCLGRVLLKRSRILVLDEATASIDAATDSLLQKVIREEFNSCTVITVAHRIPTVIDSDMIMALRDGRLMEFDKPSKLMEEKTSLFARLVAEYWSNSNRPAPATS